MHVLGLPPAFVLSQDQTLRLNEISSRLLLGHALTRSHLDIPAEAERRIVSSQRIRKPPKSRSRRQTDPKTRMAPAKTSPSTFLFLLTRLSKNRTAPSRDRQAAQPIDFTLSAATRLNRPGRSPPLLVGNTKPQRRANSGPAAGGRGDILRPIPPVNSRFGARSKLFSVSTADRIGAPCDRRQRPLR